MTADARLLAALSTVLDATPPFDLACIGTSIHGLGAFTLESFACLRRADTVYYYPPSSEHFAFMRRINENLVNVNETIYVKGSAFEPAYAAIVAEVMSAVRTGRKVAYAVQGSPAFHCGTAVRLHRAARSEGFRSILLGGISSLELLTAELSEHYDVTNMQIYSVHRIAGETVTLDTRAPCLLFDLGRYALPAVREASSSFVRPKLAVFADRLRNTYPHDHPILLMQVTNGACRTTKVTAKQLEGALTKFGASVTIFVPAVSAIVLRQNRRGTPPMPAEPMP